MIANLVRTAALAAMIVTGGAATIAATTSTAAASGATIELRFGHAPRYARNYCDPRQAVGKASRLGVRRAHVVRNAPRRVAVRGFRRGQPVRVVFANQRGCPVIGYR